MADVCTTLPCQCTTFRLASDPHRLAFFESSSCCTLCHASHRRACCTAGVSPLDCCKVVWVTRTTVYHQRAHMHIDPVGIRRSLLSSALDCQTVSQVPHMRTVDWSNSGNVWPCWPQQGVYSCPPAGSRVLEVFNSLCGFLGSFAMVKPVTTCMLRQLWPSANVAFHAYRSTEEPSAKGRGPPGGQQRWHAQLSAHLDGLAALWLPLLESGASAW